MLGFHRVFGGVEAVFPVGTSFAFLHCWFPARLGARDTDLSQLVKEFAMLYWAGVFLVIALVAMAFGFFPVAGAALGFAKVLFFVFLILFLISMVFGMRRPVV
jgi:uncharacterized membrane protein YtjA (UPF0391 family)